MTEPQVKTLADKNAFVLDDELDELSYDFRPHVDAHGVIPEPSTTQIKQFHRALRKVIGNAAERIAASSGKSQVELLKESLAKAEELQSKADKREAFLIEACAKLCSNTPSAEEIGSLPYRGQLIFTGWLVGKFLRPQSQTPVTSK